LGLYINYNRDGQFAEDLTYDKNGNILSLKRYGEEVNGQPVEWDDLTYVYTANQLQRVTDATNNTAGFNDGNPSTGSGQADYEYDTFGNMTTDKNKGITGIKYNHLNLPTEITFANGKINYNYTATGTKVKKVVTPTGGAAQTTDYLHGFEYENTELKTFPHQEGYVKKDGANYIYHYIYRDHLGNNRLVYADLDGNGVINPATEIIEENNYYPFGLKHQGYNNLPGDGYKYKLNGKEYEDSFGLNVTETDFRQYDAATGRFSVMDALSELAPNYTPYRYGFNNPVFWSDPSGLFETEAAARMFAKENDINDYMITSDGKGRYILTITAGEFAGEQFYEMEVLVIENRDDEGGGGSDSSSGDTFLGFSPSEIGLLANGASVYAGALEANSKSNANYQYKYGSKTHSAEQLTKLNNARMTKIANVSKIAGYSTGALGTIVTFAEGFQDGNFTSGDAAKVAIGIITTFTPYGWVYGALDLGVLIITDTSLTDRIGDYIDNY